MGKEDVDRYRLKGNNILLVEDDFSSKMLLERVLVYHGASVKAVDNGEQAVSYVVAGNMIDLVILDIRLPRMDGYAVFNKIKEILPDVPVFAQTAYVFSNEQETVIALGFDAYFSKPIDIQQLIDAIDAIKSGSLETENLILT